MSNKTKVVKISRVQRHRHHRSSKKNRYSRNTIHVITHSPITKTKSMNEKPFISKNKSLISSMESDLSTYPKPWECKNMYIDSIHKQIPSIDQYKCHHEIDIPTYKSQITPILNHTRKKKKRKNKKRRCIFLSICSCFILLCFALATILAILLSKKSTIKITPSVTPLLRWNSTGMTILGIAGVPGTNSNLLKWPYGLAFDSSNTLYIVDYMNNRIQKLITDTQQAITVAGQTNGSNGNTLDRLLLPVDILFDSKDNMYITDRGNNRLQFWTKGATSGTTVAGVQGILNISFNHLSGLAKDPESNTIFIADTFNQRIISYPSGSTVAGGNGQGNNATMLYNSYGLVYESITKSFIIPNYDTHNIVRWVLGANSRTHIAGDVMGTPGSNSTLLKNPVGITIDPMGNLYVADSNNHRIQFFPIGQTNGTTIAGITNVFGVNSTQLNSPFWVILDNQLNLYVSDTFNNRIQKFLRY